MEANQNYSWPFNLWEFHVWGKNRNDFTAPLCPLILAAFFLLLELELSYLWWRFALERKLFVSELNYKSCTLIWYWKVLSSFIFVCYLLIKALSIERTSDSLLLFNFPYELFTSTLNNKTLFAAWGSLAVLKGGWWFFLS